MSPLIPELPRSLSVLIVEDDTHIADQLAAAVRSLGWLPQQAATVQAARARLTAGPVDLIVLDRMLADGEDGLALLAWFRALEVGPPGVLVTSRLSSAEDHVRGLDLGADDYLDKPFDTQELLARLRALARRIGPQRAPDSVHIWGGLELRADSGVALWNGTRFELPPLALRLLVLLAEHRGDWVSRAVLWRRGWPEQGRVPARDYVINVAVSGLRKTLAGLGSEPHRLPRVETGTGLGYRLVLPEA